MIRSVDPVTGATTLYAGSGAGSADGNRLTTATFNRPAGIASDGINLYVTDNWNYTIRMIGPDDMVRTIVGQVGVSPATPALLPFQPTGLALATVPSGTTYLYSTDYVNHTVNQIDTVTGAMTILAGQPGVAGYLDGTGPGAVLRSPIGLCSNNAYLYLADQDTHTIRRIDIATGEVLTVAGNCTGSCSGGWQIGALAAEVDFFSVGTNDLVQYLLAADRTNPLVRSWYDPLHPAVLAALRQLADGARAAGRGLSICGEMAADPGQFLLLFGMGYREFSLPAPFIPGMRSCSRG